MNGTLGGRSAWVESERARERESPAAAGHSGPGVHTFRAGSRSGSGAHLTVPSLFPLMASSSPSVPHRGLRAGSMESISSAARRHDHVSGMGVSSASGASEEVVQPAPEQARGRVQDRLVWRQPAPSGKAKWRRRMQLRSQAAGPSNRRPVPPEMEGLCFNCFREGHLKVDCKFPPVCLRCGKEGHPAKECELPRNPAGEEAMLRRIAMSRRHLRDSPEQVRPAQRRMQYIARAPQRPLPPPPPPVQAPPPPPPPQAHRPAVVAWPQLRAEPAAHAGVDQGEGAGGLDAILAPVCVVRRSAAINSLEQRLEFAMVAYVGGNRPAVSCDLALEAVLTAGVPRSEVSVHRFAPEDFLVVFARAEHRNRVAALPFIEHKGFSLFFRPWNRQAQATHVTLGSRVEVLIEGIPPHAWETEVAEDLLGKSCAVEEVAPETRSRWDLSAFKLTAWTSDVESIPVARTLVVPEPVLRESRTPSPAREFPEDVFVRSPSPVVSPAEIQTLRYKVLVHVTSVEEEAGPEEWLMPASSGSDQSGLPDNGRPGGGDRYDRRIKRSLPWQMGLPDRRGWNADGGRQQNGPRHASYAAAAAAPANWRLPEMEGPGPLVVQTKAAKGQGLRGKADLPAAPGVIEKSPREKAPLPDASAALADLSPAELSVRLSQKATEPLEVVAVTNERAPVPQLLRREVVVESVLHGEVQAAPVQLENDGGGTVTAVVGSVTSDTANDLSDPEESASALGQVDQAGFFSVPLSANETVCPAMEDGVGQLFPVFSSAGGVGTHAPEYVQVSLSDGEENSDDERWLECHADSDTERKEEADEWADPVSPCESYTGPNSNMQMIHRPHEQEQEIESPKSPPEDSFDRIRVFCANILKTLAPPLLKEIETSNQLRADAEPFTPRRVTRRSASCVAQSTTQVKKASAAETALLKALGITPSDLSVSEEDLHVFRQMFDSPMREQHLRVVASIFGKVVPPSFERSEGSRLAITA